MEPVPPSPTRVLVADVWADEQCTVKPSGEGAQVYVRVLRADLIQEGYTWGSSDDFNTFMSVDVTNDPPEWELSLWVDYQSGLRDLPFSNGIILCSNGGVIMPFGSQTEFYIDL